MSDERPTYDVWFWVGLAVSVPILTYAARGVLDALPGVQLTSFLRFFIGGAVVHDLVVAPAVCIFAWLVVRRLPPTALGPVQAALIATGVAALLSWPFVRGYGITAGEPSFLSRNYTASLATYVVVVWTLAAIAVAVRVVSARRR